MSTQFSLPPLRIEVRAVPTPGAEATSPWNFLDVAQTQDQADSKIKRAKLPTDWESRTVANEPIGAAPAAAEPQDTPETRQLLETINAEKLTLQRQLNAAQNQVARMLKYSLDEPALRRKFGLENAAFEKPAVDALAGETPLPFGVGDWMRDIHTGVAIKVTELNPKHTHGPARGEVRPGFAWENLSTQPGDKDHTGFCPLGSIGCFVKIKEGDPVKLEPSAPVPSTPTT
jgi:hypothetical protein